MSTATKHPVIVLPTFKCLVCRHEWHPRVPTVPYRCAGCKSPYWNRPKPKGGKA